MRLAGGIPERISVRHPPSGKPLDALVIGGGSDIGPEHYGGDVKARVKADPERDALEIDWIKKAIRDNIPILGIYRCVQLINVVLGGDLHQDIRSLRIRTSDRPGDGLKAVGWDRDRIVQAIESESARPIIGVQWHPEYLIYLPSQLALFRWLPAYAKR